MSKTLKVLVCPLDWGLGHATRCIPIIKELTNQKADVCVGGSGKSLILLREEFPEMRWIYLPGYNMKYSGRPFFFLSLILQMPLFLLSTLREYLLLMKIQKHENFDIIISDNRYGLHSPACISVIITHQINVILPFWLKIFEKAVRNFIQNRINLFDSCWIPDLPGENNLSGALAHKVEQLKNYKFTGILSRLTKLNDSPNKQFTYEIVVVVSGPEPCRSQFERILEKALKNSGKKSLLIRGLPGKKQIEASGNFFKVNHLKTSEFLEIMQQARYLICRSGYSTVMDLVSMKKSALLVPTPGQTEQEYLAEFLMGKGFFPFIKQRNFNLENAFVLLESFSFAKLPELEKGLLNEIIQSLLKMPLGKHEKTCHDCC